MYLLIIGLVINTIISTYSAPSYPPDFFLKGPSSQATINGPDGSKIVSEADAGSISSKGIVGPTFKASTVVGNAQSSQNCGACGSDSVNSNSSSGGDKVLIQGPSMTSSITGPTNTADISGSSSSEQGYYASLPNGQDHNKVGDSEISPDCDHKNSASSNLNNAYLPPVESSKQPSNQHSGNNGVYNEHIQHSRGLSVDIQGPSVHSTQNGPQNGATNYDHTIPHHTPSFTSSSHTLSSQSGSLLPANHNANQGHSVSVQGPTSPSFSNTNGAIAKDANQHTGAHSAVDQGSYVHSTNTGPEHKINSSESNPNSGEYHEYSSIKATYIQPNQPSISPDYSHIVSFPISDHASFQSSHKSGDEFPSGHVQYPTAHSTITGPQNNVGLTVSSPNSEAIHVQPNNQGADQGYSHSSSSTLSSHTPNNNGGSESLLHPNNVIVQDLGNSGDNKPASSLYPSSGSPYKGFSSNIKGSHNYYDSSSFAPPTYMRPDHTNGNNAGNLLLDSQETGLSSFNNGDAGGDYDCYILKLPLNTYAYIVPSDDSLFLKKLAESAPVKPQIYYVHKSHHHQHSH